MNKEVGFQFYLTIKETEKVKIWAKQISDKFREIDHECFGTGITYAFSPFEFGEQITIKYAGHELLVRTAFEDDEIS